MPLEREWVSIVDPDDERRVYTFDVSFLLSNYQCTYGAGCPGIDPQDPDPVVGCCIHGAYLNEDDDARALRRLVRKRLSPETMFHHAEAMEDGILEDDEDGDTKTRVIDGGCIFVNPAGFEAGAGCALHHLALRDGEHHMTYKPVVCWQVPIHRTIHERTANDGEDMEEHVIAAFERGTWGDGGADFSYWCTDDPSQFSGSRPVYVDMEHELRAMVGDDVYDELRDYLDVRKGDASRVRFLPIV